MARKTTGNTAANLSKKTATSVQPAALQVVPDLGKEVRKNGKPASVTPVNLEEEIRRRAYELYLQRRATAGGESGDENQDWLVAEREILSLHGGQEHHSA
ncbi:MAG: DUF2934 domain-containing protein [Terriglobales bacterium]